MQPTNSSESPAADDFPTVGRWERVVPTGVEVWSPDYYRLYGINPTSHEASFETWLEMVHPDDRQDILDNHELIQQQRSLEVAAEFRILHSDGVRWIQETGRNFYDREGRLIRMVGIAIDITSWKSQEQSTKESERRRNEMFAMIGHEFRQPISVISSAIKMWKRFPEKLPMQLEEIVEQQVGRLDSLVSGLLASVRAKQGQLTLNLGTVEPSGRIPDIVKRAHLQFAKKHHQIDAHYSAFLPTIIADPLWFDQVCENLLSNACKYTPSGGKILITVRLEEGDISISVKDNGMGLRSEAQGDIFTIFHRETGETHNTINGLGIGLAIVKQVVEMHGGSVQVSSAGLGTGSEFTVRFPVSGPHSKLSSTDAA